MKAKIDDVDVFILNIYINENCRCSLQELYAMSFPDLCDLHNFLAFNDALKTKQQHQQMLDMDAAQHKQR